MLMTIHKLPLDNLTEFGKVVLDAFKKAECAFP